MKTEFLKEMERNYKLREQQKLLQLQPVETVSQPSQPSQPSSPEVAKKIDFGRISQPYHKQIKPIFHIIKSPKIIIPKLTFSAKTTPPKQPPPRATPPQPLKPLKKKVRQFFEIHRNARHKRTKKQKMQIKALKKCFINQTRKKSNEIKKRTIILSKPPLSEEKAIFKLNKLRLKKPVLKKSQSIFQSQKFENRFSGFSKFKRTKSLTLKDKESAVGKKYKKPAHLQKILESILSDPKNFQSAVNVYMNQTNNIFVTNNFNFNFQSQSPQHSTEEEI